MVKNPPAMRRPGLDPWVGRIPWRRKSAHSRSRRAGGGTCSSRENVNAARKGRASTYSACSASPGGVWSRGLRVRLRLMDVR